MAEHVSLSNPSISVKLGKTNTRVWKVPLQKEGVWVGVRCLWCRPDTAQECAISCFLQHQENQRVRDRLPAHSSKPSNQWTFYWGDLSQATAPGPWLCMAICVVLGFFLFIFPCLFVVVVALFSLWLQFPPLRYPYALVHTSQSPETLWHISSLKTSATP